RFRDADVERAAAVASELATLVVEHESFLRREQTKQGAAARGLATEEARDEVARRHQALVAREIEKAPPGEPKAAAMRRMVEIEGLRRDLAAAETQLALAVKDQHALEMRADIEHRRLGLSFEVVDTGRDEVSHIRLGTGLVLSGLVLFLLVLP